LVKIKKFAGDKIRCLLSGNWLQVRGSPGYFSLVESRGPGSPCFQGEEDLQLEFQFLPRGAAKSFIFNSVRAMVMSSNSWSCKSHLMKCLNILKWAVLYSVCAQPCWVGSQKSSRGSRSSFNFCAIVQLYRLFHDAIYLPPGLLNMQ